MKSTVMIKGTKSGIILVLDQQKEWDSLKKEIAKKFQDSSEFLGDAQKAISFQGRTLTNEEQQEVLDIIEENCNLQIICVLEKDPGQEAVFARALEESTSQKDSGTEKIPDNLLQSDNGTGFFFKGNLRSGQVLDVETSIIVLGDVNAGAKVVSKGNVIILGSLKGNVFAGSGGNVDAFVVALDMCPVQIRIADTIARSPDQAPKKSRQRETKIAFWDDGNIYIEPLDKDVLGDIRLS
jgi:septum site-determining protein MinC